MHRQQEFRIVMAACDIVDGDLEMQAADILVTLEVEGRGGSGGRKQGCRQDEGHDETTARQRRERVCHAR